MDYVPAIIISIPIGLCFLGRFLLIKGIIFALFAAGSFDNNK